ncbi:hypothetical protein HGP28_04650 [Vibrio sp. SM6]|uniref:Uncharacterized protein n=1 Tax=Vibrio agarilyticus TaxID=2726741 RepID=A0A7X8TNV4_9VIBR|nr:hypothetical protein [Vibrio agarilyticus]NLS12183.1 hypothetical protein [Vibrio agarilyticus]
MERRTFVKLGTGAIGAVLLPSTALSGLSIDPSSEKSRLTSKELAQLNIPFPTQTVTPENGVSVTFALEPRIARRGNW